MIVTTILPIFFLYFVLVSGYCAEILNCGLQKYMDHHIMIRHMLIFISIYIFTFVLNWYTFDSLYIQSLGEPEEEVVEKKTITKKINLAKLAKWFYYSVFIYIIFLISTKSEVQYILYFFYYIALGLIAQIGLKSFSTKQYKQIYNKLFITSEDYNEENSEYIIPIHNITSAGFIGIIGILCFGFYKYYLRQWKDHKKHWSWFKFLFGAAHRGKECANL